MIDVTDQPITKIAEDRFGRREFAKRIASVISSLQGESCISGGLVGGILI